MSDWRQEAARAVEAELEYARRMDEWNLLGPLQQTSAGEYVVDVRERQLGPLEDIRIAGENGPRQGAAVPVGGALDGGVLWLHDVGPLPPDCDRVWVKQLSPESALTRLARGLRDISCAPLADRLVAGRLDPARTVTEACSTPGVRLVWGPPGTGKTTTIATIVADLARSGKRVLHITSEDPVITMELGDQAHAIQQGLVELAAADQRLVELDETLVGYHHDTFLAAEKRIENRQQAATLEAELTDVQEHHAEVARELAQAQAYVRATQQSRDRVARERSNRAEFHVLTERIAHLDDRCAELRERLRTSRRVYRGKRNDRKDLQAADVERCLLADRLDHTRQHTRRHTDHEMHRLDTELSRARTRLAAAARAETQARAQLQLLRDKIADLRSQGVASDQDQRFHAECTRRGLPDLQKERERLRQQSKGRAAQRGRLEERLWWLGERAHRYRYETGVAAWESGQVVTTPLGRHAFTSRPFDVVIVDDAGSARMSEVLLAVAQARQTAVVFGDFARSRLPAESKDPQNAPDVAAWPLFTPFRYCGIREPSDAVHRRGCLNLLRQFRCGDAVRRLANHTGYRILEQGSPETTDIVLLEAAEKPVARAAEELTPVLSAHGGAVVVPDRSRIGPWHEALRDTFPVALGTPQTLPGREYATVVVDLGQDDWCDQARSFAAVISCARDRLYLLVDSESLETASAGSPLAAVRSLYREGAISTRRTDSVLIPSQRQQSSTVEGAELTRRDSGMSR